MMETTPDRLGAGGQPAEGGEATVDPRLGTVLDTYRLDALIGEGSVTRVYLGTDRRGAQVAVKVLDSRFARDPRMRWRFFRDASISEQISHPASLKYLRKDVTREGDPFVVVELIRGAHGAALATARKVGAEIKHVHRPPLRWHRSPAPPDPARAPQSSPTGPR